MSQATKTRAVAKVESEVVDPRARMKEIRTIVARAVKNQQRLDLMSFNEPDRSRVIIALQDALEATNGRHKKASKHVATQKDMLMGLAGMTQIISEHALETLLRDQDRITDLSVALRRERESHGETAQMLNDVHRQNMELQEEVHALKISLRSALNN